jgi:hypothetical protein
MRAFERRVAALGLSVLGFGLMGMGAMGGGGRDAGLPARDFRATFTDLDGTRIEATRVSAGSETSVEGEIGRGRLRIPFDNITRLQLEPDSQARDRVRVRVTLREGEPVTLSLRTSTTFYGQTPSGAYQIRARDLRSVDFAGH